MLNRASRNKRRFVFLVKITLAFILFAYLFNSGSLDFRSIAEVSNRLDLFLPALLCLFLGVAISGVRWWILLRVTGNIIHLNTVLSLQLMASFFSTWLPGAAGGDAVRAIQIFRLLDNGRSSALLSIITDRLFSLVGLVSIAVLVSLFLPSEVVNSESISSYVVLIKIIAFSFGLGILVSPFAIWLALKYALLEYLPTGVRGYLSAILGTVVEYQKKWPVLLLCWMISVFASGIVAVGIVLIASSFPYAADPLVSAIAGVFGNVFSAIPITPGGLGVGESIFAKICTDLSSRVAPFATIYFTFRVGMLIANAPGMVIAFLYNHPKHRDMARSRAKI